MGVSVITVCLSCHCKYPKWVGLYMVYLATAMLAIVKMIKNAKRMKCIEYSMCFTSTADLPRVAV